MTDRRLLSASFARVALLVAPLALVGWATGAKGASPMGWDHEAGVFESDTIVTRADSLRARILDRVRGNDLPPTTGDTIPEPPATDTTGAPVDGAPVPMTLPTAAPGVGTGGETRIRVPPRLPSGADSIMRALAELPGYTAATYSGTRADFTALDRRLTLFGNPEVRARFSGQGADVEADTSIVYDELSGRVRTTGPTLATFPGEEPVQSSSIVYDLTTRWATARDARTTYSEGQGNWIVQSNVISTRDDIGYSRGATFTSCDHDPPHSHFHAESMKVIAERVLIARNVRLYFDNVPVAWLPFMAQPMTSGRSSGLLTPGFSVNDIVRTSDGRNRRISNIGYYWAMSDYTDATLAMEWWSNQYTALTGSLRYRWGRQFLDGDVAMRRFWRDTGARDFAISTRNRWEPMERTRFSLSGNYVTNTGLVRRNSLDPRELTSSIDSNAGVQHRFDWGNLSVSARRQQYLSDDRLEMTLPNASLSMNTRTLLAAPPQTATWYNNISLSGSSSFSRDVREFPVQPDTIFRINRADNTRTQARLRGSMGLGNLSLSSQMNYRETVFPEVPAEFLIPGAEGMMVVPGIGPGGGIAMGPLFQSAPPESGEFTDFSDATADWNLALSYQQRLMGNSTLTPSVSVSGNMARVDSIPDATSFVSAPTRMSLSVNARTEVFGFYPGFAGFEAIRHKLSPGITYSYSPASSPDPLQERVFGSRDLRVQNQVSISLNQTFEARVQEREEEPASPAVGPGADRPDPGLLLDPDAIQAPDPGAPPLLSEDEDTDLVDVEAEPEDGGPRRAPQSRVVTLLGLNTSAVQYDIVQADSTGRFIDGFTTTRLSNTVRSDYLRGLSLSFAHSLFEESGTAEEGMERRLAPHLEQLSLSFSIDHRSGLVRAIGGILGIDPSTDTDAPGAPGGPAQPDGFDDDDDFGPTDGFDQSQVMPSSSRAGPREGGVRRPGWDARLSYSLRRPRDTAGGVGGGARNQMVSASLSFQPTVNWDATWQTTYDVEENRFNDHILQLRRDLHEWEASFGFRQTASGNWSFQFDVSLRANRDLRFDYEQRNMDGRVGAPGEALGGF